MLLCCSYTSSNFLAVGNFSRWCSTTWRTYCFCSSSLAKEELKFVICATPRSARSFVTLNADTVSFAFWYASFWYVFWYASATVGSSYDVLKSVWSIFGHKSQKRLNMSKTGDLDKESTKMKTFFKSNFMIWYNPISWYDMMLKSLQKCQSKMTRVAVSKINIHIC